MPVSGAIFGIVGRICRNYAKKPGIFGAPAPAATNAHGRPRPNKAAREQEGLRAKNLTFSAPAQGRPRTAPCARTNGRANKAAREQDGRQLANAPKGDIFGAHDAPATTINRHPHARTRRAREQEPSRDARDAPRRHVGRRDPSDAVPAPQIVTFSARHATPAGMPGGRRPRTSANKTSPEGQPSPRPTTGATIIPRARRRRPDAPQAPAAIVTAPRGARQQYIDDARRPRKPERQICRICVGIALRAPARNR